MTTRVSLVSPATSEALREVRFGDGPLDPAGEARARRAAGAFPPETSAMTSPSVRCGSTARALGLVRTVAVPALAGCGMGRWRGRTLDDVAGTDPAALSLWLSDPAAAPHGGESVRDLRVRVGAWLDALRAEPSGRVVAVVEPDVVRAAVVHALAAGDAAFWRIDVRPLTVTEFSGRAGRWNVLSGRPLESGTGGESRPRAPDGHAS
ncbi:histidine phosphatase family protein [Streptomyces termitum]|uniref:Phosphoglycerate mutase n=1 Tax=Streptomyces termitum TaxID=67368 RepID=A0A918T2F8_9ACTN|nr:histidine phosphatase family protein [Streptomyces termitum]GHA86923.1 phosphoglycerate mutase [Streptomyces termitum]